MRSATAYFAGAGTVIVAIAAGLGGGLLISNIVSPQQSKHAGSEVTRLERRMSPEPIPASTDRLEPVPYLAQSQIAAAVADTPSQPQPASQPSPPQAAQTQAAAQPDEAKPPASSSPPAAQPAAASEPPAARERPAGEESFAS